jgi:hypothetical protein
MVYAKKVGTDNVIPALIDSDISHKAFKKNWARLIRKVYHVDPSMYPKCSGTMKKTPIIRAGLTPHFGRAECFRTSRIYRY